MEENRLSHKWLPEPRVTDDTNATRDEHALHWLARSSLPRAREARRFLNENLSKLPLEAQPSFQHNLKVRWKSAFFELIVFRILQELGATIRVEETTATGKRPDFTAQFCDGTIIVEAISPDTTAEFEEVSKERVPLMKIIEDRVPDDWSVSVVELPNIGLNDPKKEFKKTVMRMLSLLKVVEAQETKELTEEIRSGKIRLIAQPRKPNGSQILTEPPIAIWDDTQDKIDKALQRKKKQVRGAGLPVLLAIEASGISSKFEDFDLALFGTDFERYNDQYEMVETGFEPNGVFNKDNKEAPTYAGVLAFTSVGFTEGQPPVLYRHPRFSGVIPEAILSLEQRIYNANLKSVQTLPAKIVDLKQKLRFVDPIY